MVNANLLGTVSILQAAKAVGCERLVVTGTAEEPGIGENGAVPTSPYAASKAAAMLYAQMYYHLYNLPVTIVRPFVAYGPRQHPDKLIPYAICTLLHGERPVIQSPDRICDFIFIGDLVRGYLKAGLQEAAIGKEVQLGTGSGTRIADVVRILTNLIPQDGKAMPTDSVDLAVQRQME